MKNKIRWCYLPHKKYGMEEESTINDYRIDKGLTWAELVKKTKISQYALRRLLIGYDSPFLEVGHNKGNIKKKCFDFNVIF